MKTGKSKDDNFKNPNKRKYEIDNDDQETMDRISYD